MFRSRWIHLGAAAVAALATVATSVPDARPASAATTGVVSGTVWRDRDSDGVRDSWEPGVAGVVITREGTSYRAVTGSDGRWSLTLPAGSVTLSAITGWLPSACPGDLHCSAGRKKNQRFAVENQFVRARVKVVAGGRISGLDLGLLPDHGDPTGSATSLHRGNDGGDGYALGRDLAVRNSSKQWYGGCKDPDRTRVCPVGNRLWALGQLYNQGVSKATGIRFVITIPRGTILSVDPAPDRATPGPAPSKTGRTGTTADGGRWIEFRLGRDLPPASAVWFSYAYRIVGGPLSPRPYSTRYDHEGFVSVSRTDQGDQDSPLRVDPGRGRDGGHNINWPKAKDDDTSDAIAWNVG